MVSHFAMSSLRTRNGFALITQRSALMNSRGLTVQLGKVWAENRNNSCKYVQQYLQASGQEPSLETQLYQISFVNDWQQNLCFLLLLCPKPGIRELAQVIHISGCITFYWLLLVCFFKFFSQRDGSCSRA